MPTRNHTDDANASGASDPSVPCAVSGVQGLTREIARSLPVPALPRESLPVAPLVGDDDVRRLVRDRWPIVLRDLLDVIRNIFERAGVPSDRAEAIAVSVTMGVAHYFGGRMSYLPRGERLATGMVHLQMYREFDGRNHRHLAEKYGMNIVTVYSVLKEQHAIFQRELRSRDKARGE
jgi:Mor family transcriptional regulator